MSPGAGTATLRDAALDYAARGWAVFPLSPGTKIPFKGSEGFKDATTDREQILAWWSATPDANIGVATGQRSALTVLDVDTKADKHGDMALAALVEQHGALPVTLMQRTWSGGCHHVFAYAPGVGNSAGKLGPGLDTRGDGGYIVAAPSVVHEHDRGGEYAWALFAGPDDLPLAPMPSWLLALLVPETTNGHPAPAAPVEDVIPGGQRNATLASLAGTMRRRGMETSAIVAALLDTNQKRCQPPLPEREVHAIADSVGRYPASEQNAPTAVPYIETLAAFLAEEDPPVSVIFPDLLPAGVILLLHGEPRARKSLAAFELALAAATGTAPFGLARFQPSGEVGVLYIQEEDPRSLTRPRLRRLVLERCGDRVPSTLHVVVRRGVDLDDPLWVEQLVADLTRLDIRLLVLDAARRLSTKTDEGPAKVRELMATLRALVTRAQVTIVVVHHDIKPPTVGQDQRRRGQRASGGDWFAGCECPVHVERVDGHDSLVYPQDYKFAADPAPFTFTCVVDGRLVASLAGKDTTTDHAETAGERGKVLEWLRLNGPAAKTAMKKAGFGWATITPLLDGLLRDGLVDETPGRTAKSRLYFVIGEPSSDSEDSSAHGRSDAL